MKNLPLISFVLLITLTACAKTGLKRMPSNNSSFEITLLFEIDEIKVYRFMDAGHYHYFASKGEVSSCKLKSLGKSYYTQYENIQTVE